MSSTDTFYTAESVSDIDNISDFDHTDMPQKEWRAVLVEGQCQSGKTFRVNKLLKEKIKPYSETLVLIITQANNNSTAIQTLERAQNDLADIIKIENMYKSIDAPEDICKNDNYLVVDFWHSRNMDNMKRFATNFKKIVIVIDEADQGGNKGISTRIEFISEIERIVPDCRLFFVTATTANLSKAILKISESNKVKYSRGSIVHDILYEEVVEYQNVKPSSEYIGTTRMIEEGIIYLQFKTKASMDEDINYAEYKKDTIIKKIKDIPCIKKEFTLIATSSRIEDHQSMVQPLMNVGYNVVVEMNGKNEKNYNVSYMSGGKIKTWKIPTKEIYQAANDGVLSKLALPDGKFDTGIVRQENCSLPDILQSTLFMGTICMNRIRKNVSNKTFMKLFAMYSATINMRTNRRPDDYPNEPCVALVVGNMASRGITIQDPYIDLICTSFVFTDLNDTIQRGARSTQKFGRACGNLFCKYEEERVPIVIATRKIVEAALANYNAVNENSNNIKNGQHISLRHYISAEDWKGFTSDAKHTIKVLIKNKSVGTINNVELIEKLNKYMNPNENTIVAKIFRFLFKSTSNGLFVTIQDIKDGIDYKKSDSEFISNIKSAHTDKANLGKLWIYKKNNIQINMELLKYIK